MKNFFKIIFGALIDTISERMRQRECERRERKKREREKREADELAYRTAKENAQYHATQAAKIRAAAERTRK